MQIFSEILIVILIKFSLPHMIMLQEPMTCCFNYEIYSVLQLKNIISLKMNPNPFPLKIQLPIPPRFQWQNGHGYCGQTCIQTCLIYYGGYISQSLVRKIAHGEVLVSENAQKTLQKLCFTFQPFPSSSPQPQYRAYLEWIKFHLSKAHPVIICGYEPEGDSDQYDHIYLAVGYKAKKGEQFCQEDQLVYMDLFDDQYTKTAFGAIYDDRTMAGNGKNLDFAITKNVCYGVAVTGILNPNKKFLPITLVFTKNFQPNVSMQQQPQILEYKIQVSCLKQGCNYILLRYENYKKLPKSDIYSQIDDDQAAEVHKFVAKGEKWEGKGKVMSNLSVFYRCLELTEGTEQKQEDNQRMNEVE